MKFLRASLACSIFALLAACGGGGGGAGSTNGNGGSNGGTNTTTTVADFQLGFNKNTLENSGGDEVVVTVTALDANNNVAKDVPVTVTVDAGAVYAATTEKTGQDGKATGKLTSPVNKTNRVIVVTAKIGTVIKTANISVVGSAISVVPLPAAPTVGENVSYNISLKDSGGVGIAGASISLSGSIGASGSVQTDVSGNASVNFVAPAAAGTYTFAASGSGVTTTKSVLVVGASGTGSVPNATTITNASLNSNVAQIKPNLSSITSNRAVLTFRMIDNLNQAVQNMRVRFSIVAPGLGAGEAMSTGNSIVYTDAQGVASSDYIAGQRSSPTNGVQVRACYAATDAALANNACPNQKTATLTVAGAALNLSIFSNNVSEGVGTGNIIYKKVYTIQVADSAGGAVPGAVVSAAVDVTHYGKGSFGGEYVRGRIAPTVSDNTLTGTLNALIDAQGNQQLISVPGNNVVVTTPAGGTSTINFRVWCANEDKNRNGVLDNGEDVDSDGVLDPRVSDVVVLALGSNITDSSGNVSFQVQWGQNVATWIAFTLKVTTNVGGSEGTNSTSFVTNYLVADDANGSFRTPPYGINPCSVNN